MVGRTASKVEVQNVNEPVLLLGIELIDVDWDNRRGAIQAGRVQGIRPGMIFGVVRGDRPIARARVREVRDAVAAVVFEDTRENAVPQAGDRLILWSAAEEKR